VIICAPDFDLSAEIGQAIGSGSQLSGMQSVERSQAIPEMARGMRAHGIERVMPLYGALEEGQEICRLLGRCSLYTGPAASKNAVRSLRSPKILHAATHAFSVVRDEEHPDEFDELFSCGLVLAGANAVMSGLKVDSARGLVAPLLARESSDCIGPSPPLVLAAL
jgi:hypothetical protein